MNMNKVFTLLSILLFATSGYSQQDPQFSQNMFNKLAVNAGSAGSSDAICFGGLYRNQWVSFEGSPETFVFNFDAPVFKNFGVGISILSDKIGFDKTLGAKLALAARPKLGNGRLGIGLDIGFIQKELDGKFLFNDAGDPLIPAAGIDAKVLPDIGAGLYYYTDKLYIGASALHLTEPEVDYDPIKTTMVRHFYGTVGYTFELTPSLNLKPSVFAKTDQTETQIDINASLVYNNKFWGGVSYRLDDAIVPMIGFNLAKDLKLGYAYDITTSELKSFSDGTHEIMVSYCFNVKRTPSFYMNRNVRFL